MVDANGLPPLVRRYVGRAVPGGVSGVTSVRLTQVGQMWQKPGGRPLGFFATEELSDSARDVSFSWRARFPIAPLVSVRVLDEYRGATAKLEARVLGIVPIMRKRGPALDLGEAMRYLAELPWIPQTIVANRRLEWRQLDEAAVEVATRLTSGRRAAVRLSFDEAGDVRRFVLARATETRCRQPADLVERSLHGLQDDQRRPRPDASRGSMGASGRAVHVLDGQDHVT